MKLKTVALFSVLAFGAASVHATDTQKQQQKSSAGVPEPVATKQPFEKLDTDRDGFLNHTEAAGDRDAASRFHELDRNRDEKVSRAEYDAWQKAASSSAAGGSGAGKR